MQISRLQVSRLPANKEDITQAQVDYPDNGCRGANARGSFHVRPRINFIPRVYYDVLTADGFYPIVGVHGSYSSATILPTAL